MNTDQERREENQTPSRGEKETYLRQEIRDSLEMGESYYPKNHNGIFLRPKKSSSTYWKRPNFETRTKERYRGQVKSTTKSKVSKETWTRE